MSKQRAQSRREDTGWGMRLHLEKQCDGGREESRDSKKRSSMCGTGPLCMGVGARPIWIKS
jgi:hypothetical protein